MNNKKVNSLSKSIYVYKYIWIYTYRYLQLNWICVLIISNFYYYYYYGVLQHCWSIISEWNLFFDDVAAINPVNKD